MRSGLLKGRVAPLEERRGLRSLDSGRSLRGSLDLEKRLDFGGAERLREGMSLS